MDELRMRVTLTETELNLLIEAPDSHEYWQLSESHERNDGYSTVEEGENEEIDAAARWRRSGQSALYGHTSEPGLRSSAPPSRHSALRNGACRRGYAICQA